MKHIKVGNYELIKEGEVVGEAQVEPAGTVSYFFFERDKRGKKVAGAAKITNIARKHLRNKYTWKSKAQYGLK